MIELKNPTNLSSPPPIGNTKANSGAFNGLTVTATSTSNAAAVTISPLGTSSQKGVSIAQSGTTTDFGANDTPYNSIAITNDGLATSGGAGALGLYVSMNSGGASAKGQKIAGRFLVDCAFAATNTGGDFIGVSGWAIAAATNGGTDTGSGALGTLYGAELQGHAFSGATNYSVVSGAELNAIIDTGASSKHRWGASIVGNGSIKGAVTDAALEIGAVSTAASHNYGIFFDSIHGASPLSTSGVVLGTDGTTGVTLTDFANFATYSFGGNIFNFGAPLTVTGAGAIGAKSVQLSSRASIGSTSVAADVPLTVMSNTAATVAPPFNTLLHLVAADSALNTLHLDAFANSNIVLARHASGTLASKSASGAGTNMLQVGSQTWDGSAYNTNGIITFKAVSAQSTSDHSSQILFQTISTGSVAAPSSIMVLNGPGLDATSSTVGGAVVTGGIAVSKAANVGAAVTAASAVAIPVGGTTGSGYNLSSTSNFGVYFGSGVPTLGAAIGSLYLRSDGSSTTTRMYVATSTASSSGSWASLTASS